MIACTQEEFDLIVRELTAEKPARYDALCAFAERLLLRKLERKVAARTCALLHRRGFALGGVHTPD